MKPQHCLQFLQPGRIVEVKFNNIDFGYGVVVSFERNASTDSDFNKSAFVYKINVLLKLAPEISRSGPITVERLQPPRNDKAAWVSEIVPVNLEHITKITRIKLKASTNVQSRESKISLIRGVKVCAISLSVSNEFIFF